MKCRDPILCYTTSRNTRQFRHFSLANPIYLQMHQQVFNCGTCLHCRKRRSLELASRCVLHSSLYKQNCFLTLTYDEKKPGYHNNFEYKDIQDFKKRLRQHAKRSTGQRIEIFNVHEYGKNGKKHWHLIVFNYDFTDKTVYTQRNNINLYTSKTLETLWPYGFNTIGDVSEGSAMYQSQYMEKDFKNDNAANLRKSHSKHSGIARPYFLLHYKQILSLGYIPMSGRKIPIPRYFQKLAHKHYSHFYETINFFDTKTRRALYRPFKKGEENKEIADLYIIFKNTKQDLVTELEKEWNTVISQYLTTNEIPDFIKSSNNAIYDLKNKSTQERF